MTALRGPGSALAFGTRFAAADRDVAATVPGNPQPGRMGTMPGSDGDDVLAPEVKKGRFALLGARM